MYIKNDTNIALELENTKRVFFNQLSELSIPFIIDSPNVKNQRYELLGKKPECFCIVFDLLDYTKLQMITDLWIESLCEKYSLTKQYCDDNITNLITKDNEIMVKFSSTKICEKKLHVSLITSFDLKRANAPLYKKYYKSEDGYKIIASYYDVL